MEAEESSFSKWRWAFWALPIGVTMGLFFGTLNLDARRPMPR